MAIHLRPITCKACGVVDMRPQNSKYCEACRPKSIFIPATHCKECQEPIVGRTYNATLCKKCAWDTSRYSRKRPSGPQKNDNEIARKITKYAVKQGFFLHPSNYICADCKRRQTECYDHRDYTKPLDVEAVCLPCNSSRGRGIPLFLVPKTEEAKPKTEAA